MIFEPQSRQVAVSGVLLTLPVLHITFLAQHEQFNKQFLTCLRWAASLLCMSPERGCADRELCPKHRQAPKCQKAPCHRCLYPCISCWLLVLIFQASIKEGVEPFHFHGCFSIGHLPGCTLFSLPSWHQIVVADLTLEERTCLNLLFSSCMFGDLGLARWRPPLLFSPFPPPSARLTWRTENTLTQQN